MLIDLIGRIVFNTILVLVICYLGNNSNNLKNKNMWCFFVAYNILSYICININVIGIKPFFNILALVFCDIFIMREKFKNTVIKLILTYMVLILVEALSIFILVILFNSHDFNYISNVISKNLVFSFLYNILISIALLIISKFLKNIYNKIQLIISKLNQKRIVYNMIFIFSLVLLTFVIVLLSKKILINMIMLATLIVIMSIIYFKDMKVRSEYEDTKKKYNSTQESLVEYEEMIDKYRVNNHENKNQLLMIQNMIKNKDKKVNSYIDDLVGNVYMTNEKIMMDVSIIPAGGLRATIHTKLNIMDNKKIKYYLNIDRKIRMIDFDNINSDLNLKICKIISIYIDNSIDEVDMHKDDREVNIEMYLENENLIIEISNCFKNEFDIDKIFEKKYTTKSNGHGYGLSLAKELIDSEEQLENYNKIEDDIFTQKLQIKLKK